LQQSNSDIRTIEVLERPYFVEKARFETNLAETPGPKRNKRFKTDENTQGSSSQIREQIVTRPIAAIRGHTGYLTFARKQVPLDLVAPQLVTETAN
jgi:tRNA (adenine57-N1/adenine58-N1)-methyltransferase